MGKKHPVVTPEHEDEVCAIYFSETFPSSTRPQRYVNPLLPKGAYNPLKDFCQTLNSSFKWLKPFRLFKGSRMGPSDKVSLWYVALLINTRFRFFFFKFQNKQLLRAFNVTFGQRASK